MAGSVPSLRAISHGRETDGREPSHIWHLGGAFLALTWGVAAERQIPQRSATSQGPSGREHGHRSPVCPDEMVTWSQALMGSGTHRLLFAASGLFLAARYGEDGGKPRRDAAWPGTRGCCRGARGDAGATGGGGWPCQGAAGASPSPVYQWGR